jgi:hypothetical protein
MRAGGWHEHCISIQGVKEVHMTTRIGSRTDSRALLAVAVRRECAERAPRSAPVAGAHTASAASRAPAPLEETQTLVGACLCGAVRYEVAGPLENMAHCHCSICRKHHGSAFATFVTAPLAGFRWIEGASLVETYQSSPFGQRCFCKVCGSVAPIIEAGADVVFCPAGALEGKLGVKPQRHLFVGSKARWHTISDDLPQCREV